MKTINPKIISNIWLLSLLAYIIVGAFAANEHFAVHHYRQAQTVLTTFDFLKNGIRWNYETPFMGYPWRVPMEFPIYQALVAIFVKLTSCNVVFIGKILNIVSHLIINFCIFGIVSNLQLEKKIAYLTLIFYNTFPFYFIYDLTFLCDSFTLMLCFCSLFFLTKELFYKKSVTNVIMYGFFAIITGLSKSTTFVGVLAPQAALIVCYYWWLNWNFNESIKNNFSVIKKILTVLLMFCIGLLIAILWIKSSDNVKVLNPLSNRWVSTVPDFREWNYGTISQRLTLNNWKKYFEYTFLYNKLSLILIISNLVTCLLISTFSKRITIVLIIAVYLFPVLFFFNLFWVHTYYSIANLIFLYALIAFVLAELSVHKSIWARLMAVCSFFLLLSFGIYRCYVFKNQIFKNVIEPGAYGKLHNINFKPDKDDILIQFKNSRDPYLEYYFSCKGINLTEDEFWQNGGRQGLLKLAKESKIRMLCIVNKEKLSELPKNLENILFKKASFNCSISDLPESSEYYNFFWY